MDNEIEGQMDGLEVTEALRQKDDIPIVFLIGSAAGALERVRCLESFGYPLVRLVFFQLPAKVPSSMTVTGIGSGKRFANSHCFLGSVGRKSLQPVQ